MAKKKEEQNLPLTMDNDTEPSSSITYASEVIAIIAGLAASEVEGVAGMCNVNNGLKTKNKNATRGIKVEVGTEEVSVDIYLNVEYGTPIQRAAHDVQEGVKKGIESMTGLHVVGWMCMCRASASRRRTARSWPEPERQSWSRVKLSFRNG